MQSNNQTKSKKLILLELNEFALYKINEKLKKLSKYKIIPLLVNVQNPLRISEIFRTFKVDTVYHAAAYKHVPLVEENICEGVKNNVIGTFIVAKAAIENNVSSFVFISSDKAVRPTNIMEQVKDYQNFVYKDFITITKKILPNFLLYDLAMFCNHLDLLYPSLKNKLEKVAQLH